MPAYSRDITSINNIAIERITLMTDMVITLYYYRAFIIDVIRNIAIIQSRYADSYPRDIALHSGNIQRPFPSAEVAPLYSVARSLGSLGSARSRRAVPRRPRRTASLSGSSLPPSLSRNL